MCDTHMLRRAPADRSPYTLFWVAGFELSSRREQRNGCCKRHFRPLHTENSQPRHQDATMNPPKRVLSVFFSERSQRAMLDFADVAVVVCRQDIRDRRPVPFYQTALFSMLPSIDLSS